MHFCTAFIAIAGDAQQVAPRGTFDPISWPEIEILRQLHGNDAVSSVRPFVRVEQSVRDERERLRLIYGDEITERCYPGRNPRMELETVDVTLPDPPPSWRDPITQLWHFYESVEFPAGAIPGTVPDNDHSPFDSIDVPKAELPKAKSKKEATF